MGAPGDPVSGLLRYGFLLYLFGAGQRFGWICVNNTEYFFDFQTGGWYGSSRRVGLI
jgi:hypothetical protein